MNQNHQQEEQQHPQQQQQQQQPHFQQQQHFQQHPQHHFQQHPDSANMSDYWQQLYATYGPEVYQQHVQQYQQQVQEAQQQQYQQYEAWAAYYAQQEVRQRELAQFAGENVYNDDDDGNGDENGNDDGDRHKNASEHTAKQQQQQSNKFNVFNKSNKMNMEILLFNAIQSSEYFKNLYSLKTYHEVLQEIQKHVKHVEPWTGSAGSTASYAFCLLFKLFTLKLTRRQLDGMIHSKESPYFRVLACLYIRFALEPQEQWPYYEEMLDDSTIVKYKANGEEISISGFVCGIVRDNKFLTTMFPRIPIAIQKQWNKSLEEWEEEHGSQLLLPQHKQSNRKRRRSPDHSHYAEKQQRLSGHDNLSETGKRSPSPVSEDAVARFAQRAPVHTMSSEQLAKVRENYLYSRSASASKALLENKNEETVKLGKKAWK